MAYRELELTLLSAQELKSVNLITRMHVYAVVSISGDPLTRQCTAPDTYGGRNPCWHATFRFAVPPTAAGAAGASLHVLLRTERFLGDRDVGEVVVPLSDVLAGATGVGPQPPQVASYQVRKLHRWEPRGVLNVSYRLGPVVAPVVERATDKPAVSFEAAYAPVGVPRQPSHHQSSAVAYPAPARPAGPVAAEHDEAAQKKSPVVMAYPVGVPQQASHPPTKPDAYRPPTPAPRNGGSNGLGQAGPTHVYMGPHTQIIFVGAPTTTAGPRTTSAAPRSTISPAGKNDEFMSVISPRTKEQQQAASSPVAAPSHRLDASPFSSRSSSSSSPLSPSSPCSSYSAHPSTATSPHPPADAEVTHGTNNTFRSTSSRGAAIPSPLPWSSPTVPNHSRGAAVSSPLPWSSPLTPNPL
ncbi:unnamed protein product [Miscanthus lutarioriparius]|uniref:C2 domain-containing protein n=1 Tax=Miscanthus lutarioriparius TaxID=422564 RepID=A0A811R2W0_9POAL|nr:unnamed protein product [Miscanthus lutarioriparius]